jgi:hypothetical protein
MPGTVAPWIAGLFGNWPRAQQAMNRVGKQAHGATSPPKKPGVSEVLGTLPELAVLANDVYGSKRRYDVVFADTL